MNKYICFYRSAKVTVQAETSYHAQCKAVQELHIKANRRHEISVVLAEVNGTLVVHKPLF